MKNGLRKTLLETNSSLEDCVIGVTPVQTYYNTDVLKKSTETVFGLFFGAKYAHLMKEIWAKSVI